MTMAYNEIVPEPPPNRAARAILVEEDHAVIQRGARGRAEAVLFRLQQPTRKCSLRAK
jgi:hypothetical protein